MEHTSTICNIIDKPKHLKSAFIHEIEKPTTMKMSIWNAQQMAKKIDNRSCYKMLPQEDYKPLKAEHTVSTNTRNIWAI